MRHTFAQLRDQLAGRAIVRSTAIALCVLLIIFSLLGWWWSQEPDLFDIQKTADQRAEAAEQKVVVGYTTTSTLITIAETLLNKSGGYLTNDVIPPSILLDNMPNWEFGVLVQIRDMAHAMRNDISRSQSQSVEDKDLALGEPRFNFDSNSWMFPASETEYKKGTKAFERYLARLPNSDQTTSQFYTRADNLTTWLAVVEKRLGSIAQRLSASVGQTRINTDLAGDSAAEQSTETAKQLRIKTPWMEIDNNFYEARGTAWALIHLLKAVEIDFGAVLEKKNALISLRQIIRELEATQATLWSPFILNGSGFSLLANHSLVMASYFSSANAAVIDLRNLLTQG